MLANARAAVPYHPFDYLVRLTAANVDVVTVLHNWRDLRGFHALRWVAINDSGAEVVQVVLDTSEDDGGPKAVDQDHQWSIQIQPGQQGSIHLGAGSNTPHLMCTYFRFTGQTLSLAPAVVRWALLGAQRF
jgi:hypothetical protein